MQRDSQLPQHIFFLSLESGLAVCIYSFSSSCWVGIIIPISQRENLRPKEGHTEKHQGSESTNPSDLIPRVYSIIQVYFTLVKICLLLQLNLASSKNGMSWLSITEWWRRRLVRVGAERSEYLGSVFLPWEALPGDGQDGPRLTF